MTVAETAGLRLRFLASLPFLAWIGSGSDPGPGTAVSVLGQEVLAALEDPEADAPTVRDRVKRRLIRVGTGEAMLGDIDVWLALRPAFIEEAERARTVVAFGRLNTVDIAKTRMTTLMKGRVRVGDDLRRHLDLMTGAFERDISTRGDKRIKDAAGRAAAFMQGVEATVGSAAPDAAALVLRALATQGVGQADIGPRSTVGDMLQLGLFRAQMRIAAESVGIQDQERVRDLRPEQIPSWTVAQAVERHTPDVPRREGGELNDTHLASLALYADVTLVDTRTMEGVRRLRRKDPKIGAFLGRIESYPGLEAIMDGLGTGG